MIKGIIIVNNHGKPRLVKFYQNVESEALQQTVIRRIFTQVAQRPDSFCNYVEGIVPEWGESIKLIYRHYATLYFVFAVDAQESDLGILDLIQVFVEALDKCFENVCELDLIFHSDRVHYVLDEIVMGGMVLETNISAILQSIKDQGKMHADSMTATGGGSGSGGDGSSGDHIRERLGGVASGIGSGSATAGASSDVSKWQYNW
jgi:AP-3 complex subunit sigma